MTRLLWVTVTLLVVVHPVLSRKCAATPNLRRIGMHYKPYSPSPSEPRVCPINSDKPQILSNNPDWCIGPACWRRSVTSMSSIRLHVHGTVRADNCSLVPHTVLDVWQADSHGRYGSLHPEEEEGHCRALLLADDEGKFEFETELPGSYGLLSGSMGWFDLPPFAPQHLNLVAFRPGFDILATQLFIAGDPALSHSWSVRGASPSEELTIDPKPCNRNGEDWLCAEYNIVLKPNPATLDFEHRSRFDVLQKEFCGSNLLAVALCFPILVGWLRWYLVLPFCLNVILVLHKIWLSPLLTAATASAKRRPKEKTQ